MVKAYFIAPSQNQAELWARRMGFTPKEWKRLGYIEDVQGIKHSHIPIYRVGSYLLDRDSMEVMYYLESVGIEVTFPVQEGLV